MVRWRKITRDLCSDKTRALLIVVAILVSVAGVGAVLGAYAILTREMTRGYLGTRPASAVLELDDVDATLVHEVRRRPGIVEAEARAAIWARVRLGPDWRPLLLFVIDDFGDLRSNLFQPETGLWPPPDGTMLLERKAAPVVEVSVGESVMVRTPHGAPRSLRVSGLVHDPGLAPAWQERAGYGYITRATLALLGEPPVLDELRIISADSQNTEQIAASLAAWLEADGHRVREIRIPPPGRHPHQSQLTAVLLLLVGFSLMAAALSAILIASVIAALMARQVREIAVMKTVGARPSRIAAMYAVMVLALSGIATALSVVPGVALSRLFAAVVADLLNFTLQSVSIPWWVFVVQAGCGLCLPMLAALVPITRASSATVHAAISDYGITEADFGKRRFDALLARLGGFGRSAMMVVRNAFRRRRRLALTVTLLAVGGAMFMSGLNVSRAWDAQVGEIYRTRFYDVEFRLHHAVPATATLTRVRRVPGVTDAEAWGYAPAAVHRVDGIEVVHTYPDQRHGSFAVLAPPAGTTMVRFPVIEGRWLAPEDTDGIVLNHMSLALLPGAKPSDTISISIEGRPSTWRVVGIVEEIGSPAVAYVTQTALGRVTGSDDGGARLLRIAAATNPVETIRAVEEALNDMGASVELGLPLAELRTAVGDHIAVLTRMLIAMATLLAMIGALGLASSMGIAVGERRRELGVLRAIGASPAVVLRMIVGEGVLVGVLSWPVAIALTVPLSALIGMIVGRMAFRVSLPIVISPTAALAWLVLTVVVAACASALPAWRASRVTPREALEYA